MLSRSFSNLPFIATSTIMFFSAFYFHPNMGGEGLFLPFNSLVWIAITLISSIAVWNIWRQQVVSMPAFFGLILAMPLLMLFTGFIVGLEQPLSWMMRVSAIILGFLYFFALFQFHTSRRDIHNALYVLCSALTIHALIGMVQLLPGSLLSVLIPNVGSQIPIGIFQQPNLQASLMATAIALSIYLLSTPDFNNRSLWIKLLPLACLFTATFVLMSAGSRVGLLGGGGALLLMLLSRFALFKRNRGWFATIIVLVLVGGGSGIVINDGAVRAYSKMEQIREQGTDIRKDVYRISWDVIKDKPLLGHGIGSFQRVFHEKAAEYQLKADGFKLNVHFTHPHNELLLWGVESGVVGLLAFLFACTAVVLQLVRLGWQRGGAMAALLLPITLHTQVEHPFYISAYHWAIFLFLLFIVFSQSQYKVYQLRMSFAAGVLLKGVSVIILLSVLWFCSTSLYYTHRIVYILYSGEARVSELDPIREHPYFSDVATRLLFAHFSEAEQKLEGTSVTLDYARWMEEYLKRDPDIDIFSDLIRAYAYLGDSVRMTATIERALYLYRDHPLLLEAAKDGRNIAN